MQEAWFEGCKMTDVHNVPMPVKVQPGSQGSRLSLRQGDVILEVNKVKMETVSDWNKVMVSKNKALGLLVSRDGQTLFISVGM